MASSRINVAVKTQKLALRKAITVSLHQLSSADMEQQSEAITTQLLSLPAFQTSRTISCYLSMPTAEAGTSNIVNAIFQSGKTLFVPKIQPKERRMDFLRIYSAIDLASIPSGTWGIKEPGDTWEAGKLRARVLETINGEVPNLDLIVVPGVAFDHTLLRLGHGKGYYDHFISSYVASGRTKPLLVGICLREQLLPKGEAVPHEPHDWRVDVLITPDGTITHQDLSA